jgi:hypothetical protein
VSHHNQGPVSSLSNLSSNWACLLMNQCGKGSKLGM